MEAPGSPAMTPDIDIRDRFIDSELIISDIRYRILVGFYAFWKYRSMQGDNICCTTGRLFGSVYRIVCMTFYIQED